MFKPTQISPSHHLHIRRSVRSLTPALDTRIIQRSVTFRRYPLPAISRLICLCSVCLLNVTFVTSVHNYHVSSQPYRISLRRTVGRQWQTFICDASWVFKLLPLDSFPNKANWLSSASLWGRGRMGRKRCSKLKVHARVAPRRR